jgi:hypothetical protein
VQTEELAETLAMILSQAGKDDVIRWRLAASPKSAVTLETAVRGGVAKASLILDPNQNDGLPEADYPFEAKALGNVISLPRSPVTCLDIYSRFLRSRQSADGLSVETYIPVSRTS